MVQIKKYRATTTREALEQVKRELGDNAFVLEAKRVRTNGFFGFGSQSQIEISATAAASTISSADNSANSLPLSKQKAAQVKGNRKLNLFDNSPALPNVPKQKLKNENQQARLSASITARAEDSEELELRFGNSLNTGSQSTDKLTPQRIPSKTMQSVEIAPHAPRVVHAKKELSNTLRSNNTSSSKTSEIAQTSSAAQFSKNEFERLQAELREIKFSLAAFATQSTQTPNSRADVDTVAAKEKLEPVFYEAYCELTKTGVPAEIAHLLIEEEITKNKSAAAKPSEIAYSSLINSLPTFMKFGNSPLQDDGPTILALIGATGVGKTTTIAKLAARIAARGRRVELVTLDTYRIAAVEQLKTYAEIIGAGCHIVRSAGELQTTLNRLPADASVLIDTTGRNPYDLADQTEVSDFLRKQEQILKCLVLQANIHPLDCIMAIKKYEIYGTNCLAFTKLDETMRPGGLLEIAAETSLPLVYLCAGQRVPEDLAIATPETLASRILRVKPTEKIVEPN